MPPAVAETTKHDLDDLGREDRPTRFRAGQRATADDFEDNPAAAGFELIEGVVQEKPMSDVSSWVGGKVYGRLDNFLIEHPVGWAFPQDTAFRCFGSSGDSVRKPDAAFVSRERMPRFRGRGDVRVAPELAVEVVSPNDLAGALEHKIQTFFRGGVRVVWVIHPLDRLAHVRHADGRMRAVGESDTLTAEGVLPELSIPLPDVLPPADLVPEPAPLPDD